MRERIEKIRLGRGARLREESEQNAKMLLEMLINRMHVARNERGHNVMEVQLSDTEMDALCQWGADAEDFEEDTPAEDNHDAEVDGWLGEDQDEKAR